MHPCTEFSKYKVRKAVVTNHIRWFVIKQNPPHPFWSAWQFHHINSKKTAPIIMGQLL